MFEKSLYDLIRGLRNHKGNEREYIQDSIRECRKEIKGQDMDLKATALLKLTYLEMFGHDMSWASFNVLEVMSSPKYQLKRIGYLGAVQSFRPDTEVQMLAENLLKKDLNSPAQPTVALPLTAVPHVISQSMANSLLSDILPRLTHSHPSIRKKTIVTLYRLALVYPETLRPAWPKIKERLLDEEEDASVTAAVVNVVCELGWRRPQDFLPLAPRLFDLLVEGNNNWMAIKIIKLFATLTPLEPRLVKKLLPPLTSLIKTTPAMSLLYECINGIIHGGILESAEGSREGDEIAQLCVGKLRGMLVIEGDPNLKYVALLAFNKIVESHPVLVSQHDDVVLECIDDPDISIRLRALDLVVGMVDSNNLTSIVERLLTQLRNSPVESSADDPANDRGIHEGVVPAADSDEEDAAQGVKGGEKKSNQPPPLPDDYRINIIGRILDMCMRNTYSNVNDFEWYIDMLVQLVRHVPSISTKDIDTASSFNATATADALENNVAYRIGGELRNVAVRVKSTRRETVQAIETLLSIDQRDVLFPPSGNGGFGVLEPAVWVIGEYSCFLADPTEVISSLVHSTTMQLPARTLSAYIQTTIKVFSFVAGDDRSSWSPERKSMVLLLLAKIIRFLEPLATHPSLEVQERAVEFLELIRLANEAASAQAAGQEGDFVEAPLLLTQAIPALFAGMELNPIARDAQRKVPLPEDIDLEAPINSNLNRLLEVPDFDSAEGQDDEFHQFYNQRPKPQAPVNEPAANRLQLPDYEISYQQSNGNVSDTETMARRRQMRQDRNKDDPFYIASGQGSGTATPLNNVIGSNNGEELDVDSIPIMELNLDSVPNQFQQGATAPTKKPPRRNFEIMGDESIEDDSGPPSRSGERVDSLQNKATKRSLLHVDSSGLRTLSLEGERSQNKRLDYEENEAAEAEMAAAMKEVERLRLEMERAKERIDVPEDTVVKSKRKKKKKNVDGDSEIPAEEEAQGARGSVKKKKKKKTSKDADAGSSETQPKDDPEGQSSNTIENSESAAPTVQKRKKRRQITFDEETA